MNKVKNTSLAVILLLLIIMFGTLVRNYNIEGKGIFFYDEGVYLCSAKAKYLKIVDKPKISEKDPVLKEHIGKDVPNYGSGSKVGFVFLIMLSQIIFGLSTHSSFIVSVFFGALTVFLVYLIARRIFDENAALLSAVILAVSPMHIMYSRCGLPIAAGIFFLFLAFYFYVLSLGNRRYFYMILCALMVGVSFTIHYNMLLMLPLFLGFEVLRLLFVDKESKFKFIKIMGFAAGMAIPIILWQIITLMVKGIFPVTYFEELRGSFSAIAQQSKYGADPFFFFYFFQKMEGWIVFLFFFAGIFMLVKRLKRNFNMAEFVLIVLALFPVIWYGFYPHLRVLRSFASALPAIAVIAAFAVISLGKWEKRRVLGKVLASFIIVCIVIFGVLALKPVINLRSNYGEVVKYIYENNDTKLVSYVDEMYPVFAYYMGDDVIPIGKLGEVMEYSQAETLVNIFAYNKELEGVTPYKVFKQVSFSGFNAEGGSKDKYRTDDIPVQDISLYRTDDL
ncbi:MAG: glycosyltransferase family 39 protein [Armatimonadota bacterium]